MKIHTALVFYLFFLAFSISYFYKQLGNLGSCHTWFGHIEMELLATDVKDKIKN